MRRIQFFIIALLAFFSNMKADAYEYILKGEYLYWKAQQRDVEFLRTATGTMTDFPGIIPGTDKIHEPTYSWKPGFRISLKYFPCGCGCFQPGISYTHYHTTGHKTACGVANSEGIFGAVSSLPPSVPPLTILVFPNGIPTIARGHSTLSLDFDYLDLDFFGDTKCCGCFSWNWDLGLRGAYIKSKWKTDYLVQLINLVPREDLPLAPQKVKIDWRYEAAGIKMNAGGAVDLGCGIRFYQEVTGALMLGRLKSLAESNIIPPDFGLVGICDIHNSRYKIVPVIQSETGIDWFYCLSCGYNLRVNVAFEYMKWFNLAENRYYTIPQGARFKDSCVDLDLYGLTAGATIMF